MTVLDGLGDAAAAKNATKCQQAIGKAGVAFLAARLKQLDACTGGVFKCIQTKPNDPACIAKAGAKCTALATAAAAARAKLLAAVAAKCGASLVSPENLMGATGLGYGSSDCEAVLGDEPQKVADVAECVAQRYACSASDIYATAAPRAGELRRIAGAPGDSCLPDYGGGGEDVGDVAQGKALAACTAAISKAASGLLTKKLASFTKCVDKVFACVQTKSGDAACLAKADAACAKEKAKIVAAGNKVGPAIDKKCAGLDFDRELLPQPGANLGALAARLRGTGALADLGSYERALRLDHECAADDLLRAIAPRAADLLPAFAPSLPITTAGCATP
jgi:hypothetical protein